MIGKLSPRGYVPYDCSSPPQPNHFRDGIRNSFPEEDVHDSGKTSWASIFRRIIPEEYIASTTTERQFSASTITNGTQLDFIDEWSANTMNADLAKTVLQGGWMVTAVKHCQPRRVNSHSPFYITTNNVPDFGTENENVERRIQIFPTQSLPTPTIPIPANSGIDQWLFVNASRGWQKKSTDIMN
jgi:hypothetical protein